MNTTALSSTQKGQLKKADRISIPIRLLTDDHTELKESAVEQQRSMSFVAMRRYLSGRNQELLANQKPDSDQRSNNTEEVINVK